LLLFAVLFYFILSYSSMNCIMPKGGGKGGAKRARGKAAGKEVVPDVGMEAAVMSETELPRDSGRSGCS
jgi:hypothetical protein